MTTEQISAWLQQPATPVDAADLKNTLQQYPYFLPARYMDAAQNGLQGGFTPQSLYPARLYMGNWLLFQELMRRSSAGLSAAGPLMTAEPTEKEPEQYMSDNNKEQPAPKEEPLIQPIYSEDYFLHQGIVVDDKLPEETERKEEAATGDPKSLMVVMSFSEWLMHFRSKSQKEKEEEEDRKAVKSMWQREKLAAALEEEDDEIPEEVFEMAVNSIAREDGLASESLAEILTKQGKTEQAIEMYKKLSLRNPQKSAYFAQQIDQIKKSTHL